MFKFYFLCYKLQLFFKQYIYCITFTCCKGFMNFKQTLIFYKHKIEKYENLNAFYMCLKYPITFKKLSIKKIVL